jgi:MFS family permease
LLTTILVAFEGLSVVTAVPQITADLGEIGLYSWVLTAFLLTSAVAIPIAGPVVDSLGVRTVFRLAMVLFGATSVGCALAPSMTWLVALRALQGVGGGFAFAVCTSTIGVAYPAHARSRMYAVVSSIWGGMSLLAPALAALMVRELGWASLFWINVPLCAIGAFVGWRHLPVALHAHAHRLDWLGVGLLLVFTYALLTAASELDAALFGGALLSALAYWVHARRSKHPVISLRHLMSLPFGAIHALGFGSFAAMLGPVLFAPLYVQVALEGTEAQGAWAVALFSAGWALGALAASRVVERVRADSLAIFGTGASLATLVVSAALLGPHGSVYWLLPLELAQGAAVGLVANVAFTLTQDSSAAEEIGRATTSHQFCRSVGQALGAALAGAVLFAVVQSEVGSADLVRRLIAGEPVSVGLEVREAVAEGFQAAHAASAGAGVVALAASFWVRRRVPKSNQIRCGKAGAAAG